MMFWNGMGWWGWLMMFAFWIPVILLIMWAVRPQPTAGSSKDKGALEILDERLARGEIDIKEYEERRELLTIGQ